MHGKVVILGVGNPLRGDDGLGPSAALALRGQVAAEVYDVGEVPENFLGPVRKAEPDTVLLIDAADFGAEAGEIRVVAPDDVGGIVTGTHSLPLGIFMEMVSRETGALVHMIAIQAETMELGSPMSERVSVAVDRLVRELKIVLGSGHEGRRDQSSPPGQR